MKMFTHVMLFVLSITLSFGGYAQSFTLSDTIIVDSLYINGYSDNGINLMNKTSNKMLIKWRVLINTIDTANWQILYCSYPSCRAYIAPEELCDTIDGGQQIRISNLNIEAGNTPKDCRLTIEYFDLLDSTYRDTATYLFFASSTDKGETDDKTSIQEHSGFDYIKIYPQPAVRDLFISSRLEMKSIRLVDYSGRVFFEDASSSFESEINVSQFSKGLYLLEVKTADGTIKTSKIILQ
ncbi:MAG: T9SS type A sorting domain-containing protein [Flavobacteriales bacterium]|nr:T9SS type A sorting domain-containing protein [Flavobacteriales bacterium]